MITVQRCAGYGQRLQKVQLDVQLDGSRSSFDYCAPNARPQEVDAQTISDAAFTLLAPEAVAWQYRQMDQKSTKRAHDYFFILYI